MEVDPVGCSVEKLYDCAQTLSGVKTNFKQHENDYLTILSGVKGNAQAKRLASQFTARFFSKFPGLGNAALDAILDLCEDDDVNIRKQAIKDLPMLCRESKEFLPKIADVLSQLLQTDDASELVVIQNSLMSLFRKDAKGTLIGLFSQIKTGGDIIRERAIKFLHVKIKTAAAELLNREAECHLLEEVKACMTEDCTSDEFHLFMAMLGTTTLPKMVTGQSKIVDIIGNLINFDKEFDPEDEEGQLDRLIQCCKAAAPYFSSQVKSSKFCEYICLRVLPEWESITTTDQAQILKLLAELCMFAGEVNNPLQATQNVHARLLEYLPTPPEDGSSDAAVAAASDFEFTKVECLLFAFHTMGKQAPQFLTENAEIFKEFKTRLQYFALGIQGYMRKLREVLASKKSVTTSEEDKMKTTALRSATNINSLIKDLFHSPPSYKTKIIVSWKPQSAEKAGIKRKSITFDDDATKKSADAAKKSHNSSVRSSAGNKGVYAPPMGKYSNSLDRYDSGGGYRGSRGGRGGGPRGAGRYKGNRRY